MPPISVPLPWRTVAAAQPPQASRRASSVSLLPGITIVGVSIRDSASIVSLEPLVLRGEVAGADHDVGVGRGGHELLGGGQIVVEVAEGEKLHGR